MKIKMTRKRWVWTIIFTLLFCGIGYGIYDIYSLYRSVQSTYKPLKRGISDKRTVAVSFPRKDPISILLLGVDKRAGDVGRSDTIMLLTLNPNQNKMDIFSLPRDTRTEIVGKGIEDKINHAYAFGGVEMSIASIETLLNIPIDYYVQADMKGLQGIVNTLGGVEVDNPFPFTYEGHTFPQGAQHLDGKDALAYSRMRYDDPRGDFGRADRQKQVIMDIIEKGKSIKTITRFTSLTDLLSKNIKTNLAIDDMWKIKNEYESASNRVNKLSLTGKGTTIKGVYYYIPDKTSLQQITQQLRESLELQSS